jgi:hypothetical protein
MVGELVADGIVHRREGAESVTLDLRVGDGVRCSVTGDRAQPIQLAAEGTPARSSLPLVEQLADRWGVDRARNGTRVWFEAALGVLP